MFLVCFIFYDGLFISLNKEPPDANGTASDNILFSFLNQALTLKSFNVNFRKSNILRFAINNKNVFSSLSITNLMK